MRDYSGVATRDLAEFLMDRGINPLDEDRELRDDLLRRLGPSWAKEMGDRNRKLTRIERREYQFTGLGDADQICFAFGVNVSRTFEIIPRPGMVTAALKMAEDQYKDENEQVTVDSKTLFARAEELRVLGATQLGARTPEQERKLAQDRARASVNHASAQLVG